MQCERCDDVDLEDGSCPDCGWEPAPTWGFSTFKTFWTDPDTGQDVEVRFEEWAATPGFQIWKRVDNGQRILVAPHQLKEVS